MPELKVFPEGKAYAYQAGGSLLEILLQLQLMIENPCNGKGSCGKCRVKVISGELPAPEEAERAHLSEEDLENGIRLACMIKPEQDLTIETAHKERGARILSGGYLPDFAFEQDICKKTVMIHKPTLEDQTPLEEQIRRQTGNAKLSLEVLRQVEFETGILTAVLHEDEVIRMEKGDTTDQLYGIALDIGTTTVVCSLIDMRDGSERDHAAMINPQKQFGLDVLTRISYELEHPEDGAKMLQQMIVRSINDMIGEMCERRGINRETIYEITVGANCTMLHMLLGIDAAAIGRAPFAPVFVKAKDIKVCEIGIHASPGARLYCLPSVSAYIGADIVAGAYVCGLQEEKGNTLFIDIGTNGEIVLTHGGRLLCCSCAAGPALEGMNISFGMRAAEGAVEDVKITAEGIHLQVIGNGPAEGICGSGILAALRELLRCGLVKKQGTFIQKEVLEKGDYRYDFLELNGKKREFVLSQTPKRILVTQGDIRQVQLAKGAILSGFLALLKKAGISMEDLDKVLIAGQFGAHLPADSLTETGILPKEMEDKLFYVGNTSRTGAYMALMSARVKREMEQLAEDMDYMELGAIEGYERLFSESMIFPEL